MVFGILTGFALGWNEVLYYIMAVPIAIAGGFVAGIEHRGADDGLVRGAIGGLVFGSFVLLGLEILNNEPKAYLGDPQAGLVFVTTLGGAILGALGGYWRMRQECRLALGGKRRLDLLKQPAPRHRADALVP